MKKFFLFAAAAIAALSVNAKVLDLTAVGTAIADWTPGAQATLNESESDATKGKYVFDIKGGEANETFITAQTDYVFQTKNSSDKAKAFVIYPGKCFEFGGKNGILVIKGASIGDVITLTVASKSDATGKEAKFADATGQYPKNAAWLSSEAELTLPLKNKDAEGADEDGYIWKEIKLQAAGAEIQVKEFNNGYRINKIVVGAAQGFENADAAVKAEKFYRNGQLIIRKNGVEYNALGAQL